MNNLIDTFMAIFIFIIIISTFINFMDEKNNKIADFQEDKSFERLSNDVLDKLIKSPGNPNNWEEVNYNVYPGLANLDEYSNPIPNEISYKKIKALQKDQDLLEKLLAKHVNYEIRLSPINSTVDEIVIKKGFMNIGNSYSSKRIVNCDYKSSLVILNIQNSKNTICNHNSANSLAKDHIDNKEYKWICNEINISDLNTSNYYLLTDEENPETKWTIDTNKELNYNESSTSKNPIKINEYLKNNLNFIHFKIKKDKNPKIVVIKILKNSENENLKDIDYYYKNPAIIILKIWI